MGVTELPGPDISSLHVGGGGGGGGGGGDSGGNGGDGSTERRERNRKILSISLRAIPAHCTRARAKNIRPAREGLVHDQGLDPKRDGKSLRCSWQLGKVPEASERSKAWSQEIAELGMVV